MLLTTATLSGMARPPAPPETNSAAAPTSASPSSVDVDPAVTRRIQSEGKSDFWVELGARADLSGAAEVQGWAARGKYVVDRLKQTATQSQLAVRSRLKDLGVAHQSFWAVNRVLVRNGTQSALDAVVAQPGVTAVDPRSTYRVPAPRTGTKLADTDDVAWNVGMVRANQVWDEYGVRGDGVVVGSIDSGVEYTHPALRAQYRGSRPGGAPVHDHSWFDPERRCTPSAPAPCDSDSHGTQVLGTVLGDGGPGNRIGVAPGATWIAAKACHEFSCSDESLLAAGQWMLSPTDLRGLNADPGLRPHVINNAWSNPDGTDRFFADLLRAWRASGQFATFPVGNDGFGRCATVASPASDPAAFAVGAVGADGFAAVFSSLGPSPVDGGAKPDVSAPGTNVRSSTLGGGYASSNGTSMAVAHAAGAVALLWSAQPAIVGDLAATRSALRKGAAPAEPDGIGCGDGNVYGAGILDTFASVTEVAGDGVTALSGRVSDSATGDPLPGVTVSVTGAESDETTTGHEGRYHLFLQPGTYDVSFGADGYETSTAQVEVTGSGTTYDADLVAVPRATVTGVVRDGSGHGWPLSARIRVSGREDALRTDPVTGEYAVELAVGATYSFHVTAPGYVPATRTVSVPAGGAVEDVDLLVDADCTAPGYQLAHGLLEAFDSQSTPAGWTVLNNNSFPPFFMGPEWRFDDPAGRGNLTGGEGSFAIVDSDFEGFSFDSDTELVSPSIDLSAVPEPVVRFRSDAFVNSDEIFDVDLSLDGGGSWSTVWQLAGPGDGSGDRRGPRTEEVAIPEASGQSDVRMRFHYYNAAFEWWWQLDDVLVGGAACDQLSGGLVVGTVSDAATGEPLRGARVTLGTDESVEVGRDGRYLLFAAGPGPVTASRTGWQSSTRDVDVQEDEVVRADFALGSGHLVIEPAEVDVEADVGGSTQVPVTISNDGTVDAHVSVVERDRGFTAAGAPAEPATGAAPRRVPVDASPAWHGLSDEPPDTSGPDSLGVPPWQDVAPYPGRVFDNAAATLDGKVYSVGGVTFADGLPQDSDDLYVYDPGLDRWNAGADMAMTRDAPGAAFVGGRLLVYGGWEDTGRTQDSLEAYDPATDTWESRAPAPAGRSAPGVATVGDFLYVVGGCANAACALTDSVQRYDAASDSWETLAPYPQRVAYLSCGAIDGTVHCAGGASGVEAEPISQGYSYDADADAWRPISDMIVPAWGAAHAVAGGRLVVANGIAPGGFATNEVTAYDPVTDRWTPLPGSNVTIYRGPGACGFYKVGGTVAEFPSPRTRAVERLPGQGGCAGSDVPWLEVQPRTLTVPAGGSVTVDVRIEIEDTATPGTLAAALRLVEDTPHSVPPIPVTVRVQPPATWGRVSGGVQGLGRCDTGETPLRGAVVEVDGVSRDFTVTADDEGGFVFWTDAANGPVSLTARRPGYLAGGPAGVAVAAGGSTAAAITLRRDAGCAAVSPDRVAVSVTSASTTTATVVLDNGGAAALDADVAETAYTLDPLPTTNPPAREPAPPGESDPPPGSAPVVVPSWFEASDLPGGLMNYGRAQCDGDPDHVYLVGGTNAGGVSSDSLWRYSAVTNSYAEMAPLPQDLWPEDTHLFGLAFPAVTCEAGRIHVIGGTHEFVATDAHFVYDVASDSWSAAAPPPRLVTEAAAGAWNGRIYLVSGSTLLGQGDVETTGQVDVYDIASDSWSVADSPMPVPASVAAYAQAGRYLYVVGGAAAELSDAVTTRRLDLVTGEWSLGPDLPNPRMRAGLAVTDSAIYLIAGFRLGAAGVSEVDRLDTGSWPAGAWDEIEPLPVEVFGISGSCTEAITGAEISTAGGFNGVLFGFGEVRTFVHGVLPERCPTIRSDVPWLSVAPATAGVPAGGERALDIAVDATGLAPGTHEATLIVETTDPGNPEIRLPISVEVRAVPAPSTYFSLAQPGTVAGLSVADEDIVGVDPEGTVTPYVDGSDVGLGALAIDAFSLLADGSVVLSFTGAGVVPGVPGTVDPADLVRFVPTSTGATTAGTFSLWFDGSDVGLSGAAENVDAVEVLADGRVLLSTSGDFRVPGLNADDEDAVAFAATSTGASTAGTFTLWMDASDVGLSTSDEDTDALAVRDDGVIALSTLGPLNVAGLTAENEDVVAFTSTSLGTNTSGTFASTLLLDGSSLGLGPNDVSGVDLPAPEAATPDAGTPPAEDPVKVDPRVERRLRDGGSADFWVHLRKKADLSAAEDIADWDARGEYVVDQLRRAARGSQQGVIKVLSNAGARHRAFWVTNSVLVRGGHQNVLNSLRSRSDVSEIRLHETHALPEPAVGETLDAEPVEWGIANINADLVWNELDVRGEGVVVANIDSGVEADHPALAGSFRGTRADGTIDPDHNWYDPSEVCGSPSFVPCDNSGHGTHTMGTMVGDGGPGNRIGVAPGARWIAAKGCEESSCSEFALVASGQWVLAPTDVNGASPDPSLRPNVVNNSWGGAGGGDTWYQEVVEAWVAAGIFPAFANGNEGFGQCGTVGDPGSYPESYGVGAYDVDNDIASFSSLGPSPLDGGVKPDASAPGVDVRSSVPGGGYQSFSGTSMATPHLSGTVALVLSAAPALVGDVAGTRSLIDATARDTADSSGCGGTLDDNNTFGEGRIDALAAVDASPRGDAGNLSGQVTDAGSGEPLADASVTVSGGIVPRTVHTSVDGHYELTLAGGTYTVEASTYGWRTASAPVVVAPGGSVTQDLALEPEDRTLLTGTVSDGSGHGWPLYARLVIEGYPGGPVFTDPMTGAFSVELVNGLDYTVEVTSLVNGYQTESRALSFPADSGEQFFALPITPQCSAPGYAQSGQGLFETFDSGLPDGWTVVDNIGEGQQWSFEDFAARGNLTGGTGGFAIVDSDFYGGLQDTELVTRVIDLTGVGEPTLSFDHDLRTFGAEKFDVDVSTDGGETWDNVWRQQFQDLRGPRTETVPVPAAADQPDVRVRFHYYDADFAWWWEVDDVAFGQASCGPLPGGLVVGQVTDGRTGDAVNGASLSVEGGDANAVSSRTPEDPAVGDGLYTLFAADGPQAVTATRKLYGDTTVDLDVPADGVVRGDIALRAGHLVVSEPAEQSVTLGETGETSFTVTNDGDAEARLELVERAGTVTVAGAGSPVRRVPGAITRGVHDLDPAGQAAGQAAGPATGPAAAPWETVADLPIRLSDSTTVRDADGAIWSVGGWSPDSGAIKDVFRYDPAADQWTHRKPAHETRMNSSGAMIGGSIYVAGGFDDVDFGRAPKRTLEVYDPEANTWTHAADAPVGFAAAGTAVLDGQLYAVGGCDSGFCSVSQTAALRYDPDTDSWTELAPYPEGSAFLGCAGDERRGLVFCAGGFGDVRPFELATAYAYDPGSDAWTPIADLPIPLWASAYAEANGQLVLSGGVTDFSVTNEGFAYNAFADDWEKLPPSSEVTYRASGACGFYRLGGDPPAGASLRTVERLPTHGHCGGGGLGWLDVQPELLSIPAGESVTVTLALDAGAADVTQPGRHTAAVAVLDDTPYSVDPVAVAMNVTPPGSWGKVTGTLTGRGRCDVGTSPLQRATITAEGATDQLSVKADGSYSLWMDSAQAPVRITVAAQGHVTQVRDAVGIAAGQVTTEDFSLRRAVGCASTSPGTLELEVGQGEATATDVVLENSGAGAFDFDVVEVPQLLDAVPETPPASIAGTGWFGGRAVPLGLQRYGHAQCDGDVDSYYVVGGVDARRSPQSAAFRYDVGTNTWIELAPLPEALEAPTAVCDLGTIHVLGGNASDAHYVYELATDTWSTATPLPRHVRAAASAVWDRRIYLVGGDDDLLPGGTSAAVDVFDLRTGTWSSGEPMPEPALAAGSVQAGHYLYVVGGWSDASPETNLADSQRLDLVTGTWTTGPALPAARADLALAATGEAIYAAGGDQSGGGLADGSSEVWRLATATWPAGSWTAEDDLPRRLSGNSAGFCTVGFLGGEFWSVGGVDQFRSAEGRAMLHGIGSERCATMAADVPWLSVEYLSRTVAPDSTVRLRIGVDATDLPRGEHTATLRILTTDPGASELRVPVRVVVGAAPPRLLLSVTGPAAVGGVAAADEDVFGVDRDGQVSTYVDGSDLGLGPLTLDALDRLADGSLLLSFTAPTTLPGIDGVVDDSDVVRFRPTSLGADTSGSFELWIDGSDIGLTLSSEDVDAVEVLADGRILLSTEGTVTVPGVSGASDSDLIAFTPVTVGSATAGSHELWFDGSDVGLSTTDEDVDAAAVRADGTLGLSTSGRLVVPGLTATDDDIVGFNATVVGKDTQGSFVSIQRGATLGIGPDDVTGLDFVGPG